MDRKRARIFTTAALCVLSIGWTAGSVAVARDQTQSSNSATAGDKLETEAAITDHMNSSTVSIITGTPGGTYFRIGADLAFVLDDDSKLRILPILGKGAGQNAYDLRFLKGVDLAFLRTDTLEQLRQDKRLSRIEYHIHYIAKLFDDELHVIGPNNITDARQLAGKKVTFDVKGSGTDYSGKAMFRNLGISVQAINVDQPTAFEMLRKGEVDAVVSVAAKPVAVVANFDPADKFHLIPVKYSESINESYAPASISKKDYPKLIKDDGQVETLAVGTVLGVYNHQKGSFRYKKLSRFVESFFSRFDEFLSPQRHPKWREVNLAAEVSGWTRFRPAQDWLDSQREHQVSSNDNLTKFLNEQQPGAATDKEELYQAYLKWRNTRRNTASGL